MKFELEATISTENQEWRPRLINVKTDWKIGRFLSKQNASIRQIKNNLCISISKDTIHRRIRECKKVKKEKISQTAP